jgi:hypothetical protein
VHRLEGSRFRVSSSGSRGSTVTGVNVFDFESNAKFVQALEFVERAWAEIKSKNVKKIVRPLTLNL